MSMKTSLELGFITNPHLDSPHTSCSGCTNPITPHPRPSTHRFLPGLVQPRFCRLVQPLPSMLHPTARLTIPLLKVFQQPPIRTKPKILPRTQTVWCLLLPDLTDSAVLAQPTLGSVTCSPSSSLPTLGPMHMGYSSLLTPFFIHQPLTNASGLFLPRPLLILLMKQASRDSKNLDIPLPSTIHNLEIHIY